MAESTTISIKKFDGSDYKRWSLEIEILLERKPVLGIVDGTRRHDRAQIMEEVAWNSTVHHSRRDGEVFSAAVSCTERREGAEGSAEGGLQMKGEAECGGLAR